MNAHPELSEAGFRQLFDLNPVPMWLFDASTLAFLEVNLAAIRHYGYSREQFLSMTLLDIRPSAEVGKFQHFFDEASQRPDVVRYTGEWTHRKKDGSLIHVEISSHRFPIAAREAVLSVIIDVTERRRGERLLRESEHRFRMLSEAAVEAIAVHQEFQIQEVNTSFLRLFGFKSAEQVVGRNPLEFVSDDYKATCMRKVLEMNTEPYELVMIRGDGKRIFVEVHARAIRYGDGVARVVALHDITERKLQEEELREREARLQASNRELEQFAYVTSHDLQEPLRMVASYVALLEKNCGNLLDPSAKQYIRFAVEGAKRMKQLIDDLLSFSMIGKKEFTMRPTALADVFQGVMFDLRLLIEETGARIHATHLPQVMGDPSQLRQVFYNLFTNAIKFRGDKPPRIEVNVTEDGHGDWLIEVKDYGIGIDMQYSDRIFRIFQRLHTADEYPGTGIGLAICKKIIERHQGRIWVESKPGEGTTFFLTLPRVNALYGALLA